jgi:DNA invertase Pin-like site-specific DNA recombinase
MFLLHYCTLAIEGTVLTKDVQPEKQVEHALLYARVSTQMQVNDGMSMEAQEKTLRNAAEFSGFTSVEILLEEGRSGKSISGRPVLRDALSRLDKGDAHALIVTRIDRLARSTTDFLSIVDRAAKNNWRLVLLDLNLDTSTYQGRFVTTIMSALAEMERGIIAERQKDVHKHRRDNGQVWGVDLGPKKRISEEVLNRIYAERDAGTSMNGTARILNAEGIPAAYGGKWSASSIKYVLDQQSEELK